MTPVVLTYAYLPLPHNVVDVMTAQTYEMFKQGHGKPTEICLRTKRFLCVFMFYHILCSDFFAINILLWSTKKLLVAIMCIDDIEKY